MKHIIILADGMADEPIAKLGKRTPLQAAYTPNMDWLATNGNCGLLQTVPHGMHPGSEVANMSVLGYDVRSVYQGRGVLEAASMGVEIESEQLALRCNLVCIQNGKIKNHSAGHISDDEAKVLVNYLNENLLGNELKLHAGVSYRHLLVVNNGSSQIICAPPHDHVDSDIAPLLVKPRKERGKATAILLNQLIVASMRLLKRHPINIRRAAIGLDMANAIWPWSPGVKPKMQTLSQMWQIGSSSVISAVDLIQGIGKYAGMKVVKVEGATGLYNTNYEGKAQAAIQALATDDLVYLHIEAPDEAGHEGDHQLKIRTIEDIDKRVVAPILEYAQKCDESISIAVLPDHPTPCKLRTHTAKPVPFVIYNPNSTPDSITQYDEYSTYRGSYGLIKGNSFMKELLAGR